MQSDPLFFFRIVAGMGFVADCSGGLLVMRHAGALFGFDAEVPSETASARSYSRLMFAAVFAHALLFFSAGMLFL